MLNRSSWSFWSPKPLAGIYLRVFNEREVLKNTPKVLSKTDVLRMVPTKVLYQHLFTFRRVGNSSNRMLNVITCSMTGMDRVTIVKKLQWSGKEYGRIEPASFDLCETNCVTQRFPARFQLDCRTSMCSRYTWVLGFLY